MHQVEKTTFVVLTQYEYTFPTLLLIKGILGFCNLHREAVANFNRVRLKKRPNKGKRYLFNSEVGMTKARAADKDLV